MARSAQGAVLLLSAVMIPSVALSQSAVVWPDPPAVVWPDPPGARSGYIPPPPPPPPRASRMRRAPDPEEESLPDAEALPPGPAPRTVRARRPPPPPPPADRGAPDEAVGSMPAMPPPPPRPHVAAPLNIRCDGAFAKDTSHAKLVQAFGAKNVAFQEIDSGGSKVKATVLFPNDRKRRVEIIWADAADRKRPSQIFIGGESTWRARGFQLGEALESVEKTNGKPFKLGGFGGGEYRGAARDWADGKLDKLTGGCRLGVRFALGPQAPAEAREKVSSNGDFMSDSADIRAAAPVISELVIDFPN